MPLPIIDIHLHAMTADAQGPPPLALDLSVPAGARRSRLARGAGVGDDVIVVERGDVLRAQPERDLFLGVGASLDELGMVP